MGLINKHHLVWFQNLKKHQKLVSSSRDQVILESLSPNDQSYVNPNYLIVSGSKHVLLSIPDIETFTIDTIIKINHMRRFINLCKRAFNLDYHTKPFRQIRDDLKQRVYSFIPEHLKDPSLRGISQPNITNYHDDPWVAFLYLMFLYDNWDKVFFTDYKKLGTAGELQRFVKIVKDRNLLSIASNF
jgi:hypothetical protein